MLVAPSTKSSSKNPLIPNRRDEWGTRLQTQRHKDRPTRPNMQKLAAGENYAK
jgi:hypothetical protein